MTPEAVEFELEHEGGVLHQGLDQGLVVLAQVGKGCKGDFKVLGF